VFLLAFIVQVVFDAGAGLGRTWFAEGVPPAGQLPMLWLYLTDACLSCVGLLIAASAVKRPGLVLLALPLVGLQWLLARERRQRLDYSLALSEEHRIAVELQRRLLPKHLPDVAESASPLITKRPAAVPRPAATGTTPLPFRTGAWGWSSATSPGGALPPPRRWDSYAA
jgi:hypothetical protein